jgi:hypothetical protein
MFSNTVFTGGSSGSNFAKLLARKKLATALSPIKVMSSNNAVVKGALNFEDQGEYMPINWPLFYHLTRFPVPIYNGMDKKIKFSALQNISSDLKSWEGDLVGKICLVGYTANSWIPKDATAKQLSLNIQWVVVLASD